VSTSIYNIFLKFFKKFHYQVKSPDALKKPTTVASREPIGMSRRPVVGIKKPVLADKNAASVGVKKNTTTSCISKTSSGIKKTTTTTTTTVQVKKEMSKNATVNENGMTNGSDENKDIPLNGHAPNGIEQKDEEKLIENIQQQPQSVMESEI
jgi:hypothetical protein